MQHVNVNGVVQHLSVMMVMITKMTQQFNIFMNIVQKNVGLQMVVSFNLNYCF